MVKHPREYRWSSYRVNAEGQSSELVSPHRQYLRLGREVEGPFWGQARVIVLRMVGPTDVAICVNAGGGVSGASSASLSCYRALPATPRPLVRP
jgi:hypothetical protein